METIAMTDIPVPVRPTWSAYLSAVLVTSALSLAGCAPAPMSPPLQAGPPLQADPYLPPDLPQSLPVQPIDLPQELEPVAVPQRQSPRQFDQTTSPEVFPLDEERILAEPLAAESRPTAPSGQPAKVGKPSVTYIPDKSSSPTQQPRTTPASQQPTKSNAVPFWEQGRVQVEVLDMKKPTPSAPTPLSSAPTAPTSLPALSGGSSPAVAVLVKQANNELSAGMTERAAATLERALRIAPNDASLWIRLAEANGRMGNKVQAASMARKALDLAPSDAAIRLRAQRLL